MSCCASPALDWDGLSEQSQKGDECRLDIWSFRRRKKRDRNVIGGVLYLQTLPSHPDLY